MNTTYFRTTIAVGLGLLLGCSPALTNAEQPSLPRAFIDGNGPGWKTLDGQDFVNVNCDADTWTWNDGVAH